MKIYQATFQGRTLGAIGISHKIATKTIGEDKEQARLNLYKFYEHIIQLELIELGNFITKDQYFKGAATHDQYYGQFVNEKITNNVIQRFGMTRIVRSIDQHFNDIPLKQWDNFAIPKSIANVYNMQEKTFCSISDVLCMHKEAARRIRANNAKPEKFDITVRYRDESLPSGSGTGSFSTDISGTVDSIINYYYSSGYLDHGYINVGCGPSDKVVKLLGIEFTRKGNDNEQA